MDFIPITGHCDVDSQSLLEDDSERGKKRLQNPPFWFPVGEVDEASRRISTGQEEEFLGEMGSSWLSSAAIVLAPSEGLETERD